MQDLLIERQEKLKELYDSVERLRKNAIAFSEAQKKYQVKKYQTALKLKESGMPATLINETIKGHPDVAPHMFERDLAKILYEVNRERHWVIKDDFRSIESQIKREWENASST